jgi:hypothetical protein
MPITRAQLEAVLVRRCGKKMLFVGLDATTVNGTNADLNDPIIDALGSLKVTAADQSSVSDADLLGVADEQLDQLRDFAEVRVLETVLGSFDQPDQTADAGNVQALGKLYAEWEKTVARRRVVVATQYGVGLGTLKGGTINLNLAAGF